MADGMLCKHCGYSETAHMEGEENSVDDPHIPLAGKNLSLANCLGFVPEDQALADRVRAAREKDEYERSMRSRGNMLD